MCRYGRDWVLSSTGWGGEGGDAPLAASVPWRIPFCIMCGKDRILSSCPCLCQAPSVSLPIGEIANIIYFRKRSCGQAQHDFKKNTRTLLISFVLINDKLKLKNNNKSK